MIQQLLRSLALGAGACMTISLAAAAAYPEYNPVRRAPVVIGPEAGRLIIGFRATANNAVVQTLRPRARAASFTLTQARTTAADVTALAQRVHLNAARSRQLTPSMHVLVLQKPLYGAAVAAALTALRADPAVKFAEVDQRRFPHAVAPVTPNDPRFVAEPSINASGQWFMQTPIPASPASPDSDAAATDAVSAWGLTEGSSGIVIADVDTGVRFDHPDLLRAGFGGRLLPGYDFVDQDFDPAAPYAALGTFLYANDGDGWDPDPSDPGDWISTADQANPKKLFTLTNCPKADSSWHGTRVMGLMGALTNNAVGVAGMTWNSLLLPVRALGKCGGYDSDILVGMQWAAGLTVTGVPDNPYPADIINLSLGGTGACPSSTYGDIINTLTGMGVLIVVSAGNEDGPVDAPANCPGVLAVAGLRHVGTKVGYSSLGAEIGIAAPAGNCVNTAAGSPCLRSIDTTTNTGTTGPGVNTYTDEINPNIGTSFSAPIVSGIAALMRSVNANLTPAQLIARIESSAAKFPQPVGLDVCPQSAVDPTTGKSTGECACPNVGDLTYPQCGAGMVNALGAVTAALRPIAAVAIPANTGLGNPAVLDASGSAAACNTTTGSPLSIASYAWSTTGTGVTAGTINSAAQFSVTPTGTGTGTITLKVTDSAGAVDTATFNVSAAGAITALTATPASAVNSAGACAAALTVTPVAPTVAAAFAPASVGQNVVSTLTLTLSNANAFDLTQVNLTHALPANLTLSTSSGATQPVPTTTCGGVSVLTNTSSSVTLTGANIPAKGSCTLTLPVLSATAGSYTDTVAAGDLKTGPGGANSAAVSATLTVTAPSKGGGGAWDWWDSLFVIGVLLASRRAARLRRRSGHSAAWP